ncbi:MAG: porin [Verrucomicrobiae bacterium]|nr:porin [Verrucomicrobiae bacterium]
MKTIAHTTLVILSKCGAGLLAALLLTTAQARADEATLQERVKQLEQRLAELEAKEAAATSVSTATIPAKTLEFLGQTEIGGGVMASYFYDTSKPGRSGTKIPLLGVSTYQHNAFNPNMAELYLSNPATASADKWDGGFKVSLLLGQDVAGLADGLSLGEHGAVFEAYAALNIPVLNGVVLKAGKFATYIGNEVVQPWANRMITYGFQFALVEPFTHTGVAAETAINDQWSLVLSVNNGWDQTTDLGDGVSFLGKLGFAPTKKTTFGLVGFLGPEGTGEASETRAGIDFLVSHAFSDALSGTLQFDWGTQDFDSGVSADWIAVGGWLAWDFAEKWALTLRGEYLDGDDGLPGLNLGTAAVKLYSGAVALAFRPGVPGLETRAEVRYDKSDDPVTFGDDDDRVVLSVAALYAF